MEMKNVWITHKEISRLNYTVTQIKLCAWRHILGFKPFLILRETDNVREKEEKNSRGGREKERLGMGGGNTDKKEREVVAVLQFVLTNLICKKKSCCFL